MIVTLVCAALLAAEPTAALTLERSDDARVQAECPEAPALTALVMRRLGRDPFDPLAARKAVVRFERDRAFQADVRVREPDGREGVRTLSDRACEPLAEAVALALAVAIDPLGLDRPHFVRPRWAVRAREETELLRRRRGAPDLPRPRHVPPPLPNPWRLDGGPVLGARLGIAPNLMLGLGAEVGVVDRDWRFELRADLLFASPGEVGASQVASSTAGLALAACHRGAVELCLRAGALGWTVAASQGLTLPVEDTRLLAFVALGATVAAGAHAYVGFEVLVPLPRPLLVIDGAVAWRAWSIVPALTVGARLGGDP